MKCQYLLQALIPITLIAMVHPADAEVTLWHQRCEGATDVCYQEQISEGAPIKIFPHGSGRLQTSHAPVVVETLLSGELARVHFAFDDATLSNDAKTILMRVAAELQTRKQSFVIAGHADSWGSESYNEALGLARAEEVARFLVDLGVARQQLVVRSEGEAEPVADNIASTGRSLNRRVELSQPL